MTLSDRMGSWKVRWGIGRMSYKAPAGLYAIGAPTADDPVLVTANYKMSYDLVRSNLAGCRAWLLVLDTHGINVWCAAGKGTFGTEELVRRVELTRLARIVAHRTLLLPILGAPGVAAHEITRRTGFGVRYATIRAEDLPEFLRNGNVTTPAMRELSFSLRERAVLIPVELVGASKQTLVLAALVGALVGAFGGGTAALLAVAAFLGAVLAGVVIGPLLLPWLPTPSFSVKGWIAGAVWSLAFFGAFGRGNGWVVAAGFLMLPSISAFYTLNFTGCTPFTSRSGVKKEMRIALPAMGLALAAGMLLLVTGRML